MTSSGLGTSGIETTMLPPSTLTSDSATPLELTRLRMMSTVVSSCSWVGLPPRGWVGTKVTLDPPRRSRPSRGSRPLTAITPQTRPTSANTTGGGRSSDGFLARTCSSFGLQGVQSREPSGFRACSSGSEQAVAVDGHAELAVEALGGPAAHHHPGQEDLEILQDVGDTGVDLELEGDGALGGVDPHEGVGGRVVHPVVDVELDPGVLAHPGAVDVGLVGDVDRRRHRRHRVAELLLVVADGPDDQADVVGTHAQLAEDGQGQQGRGLGVVLAGDDVADVVQVAGDGGQLGQVPVVAEPVEDVEGDVADQVGMEEAVLGVAEPAGELVGEGDVGLDDLVAGDLVEQAELAGVGPALRKAHRSGRSSSSATSDAPPTGSGLTLPEMARRLRRASTPGDSSMVTISPSKRRMVPRNPAEVTISSPSCSEDCSDCRALRRRCWGRMSRK